MLRSNRKKFLIQLATIIFFSLAGFLILFYIVLQSLVDPRALKRILGFESFASFLLTSGSGILGVSLLALILFLAIRKILFGKKIKGQTDALQRIISRFAAGDLSLDPNELKHLPAILRLEVESLRSSLQSKFEKIQRELLELNEVSYNLEQMVVNSSLRISFLSSQLENFGHGSQRMQAVLDQIRLPRPTSLQAVLVIGEGPACYSLIENLASSGNVRTIYQTCQETGHRQAGVLTFSNPDELIQACKDKQIDLVILSNEQYLSQDYHIRLVNQAIPILGYGIRFQSLDPDRLFSIFSRHRIPIQAQERIDSTEQALAFCKQSRGPWQIRSYGIQEGSETLFSASKDLADFLNSRPNLFVPEQETTILSGKPGSDYAVLAISDRKTIRNLGIAELAINQNDHDLGPATPGSGAFCPAFLPNDPIIRRINSQILGRVHHALRREGVIWHGFLTFRIHLRPDGQPLLQDFFFGLNAPEADAILASLKASLIPWGLAALRDELDSFKPKSSPEAAIAIVFTGDETPPPAPSGVKIIPYLAAQGQAFSLVCTRKQINETIQTAYLAAMPLTKTLAVRCRHDIGQRSQKFLAAKKINPLQIMFWGIKRALGWLSRLNFKQRT